MDNVFRLPFDQFQRYRLLAEIVPVLDGDGPRQSMLEVGGWPPQLGMFLPEHQITVVDKTEGEAPGYMKAEGTDLPFDDGSFGMAVSLDTLEHVVPEWREKFIDELCRVSSGCVVIAAPFSSDAVRNADRAIFEFIRKCAGYEHAFLKEHLEIDLPDLVNTMVMMVDRGLDVQVLPSGRLDRWMLMMALYYMLDSDQDLKESVPFLMEAYNRSFYDFDKAEPAYRHFLVGAREGLGKRWGQLSGLASGEAADRADNGGVALVLEFARTLATRKKDERIAELAALLDDKDRQIAAQAEHIGKLEDFMDKVKSLPLYALYEKLLKPLAKK